MRILKLTSDIVFKMFMKSEKTNLYKARMISLITNIPEKDLYNALYTVEELSIDNINEKKKITDIIVKIEDHIINIEMNKDYYEGLIKKNLMYSSKLMSEQIERGKSYTNMKKIIQINIDDYTKYNGDKLVYKFMMRDEEGNIEHEFIESYHIDLKYLERKGYNKLNELEKIFSLFEFEDIESLRGDKYMNEAINELESISNDEEIIGLYDKEIVERKLYNSRMEEAEKIGIEKGIEQGIEQGKKENTLELAKKMLDEKLDIELIINITGLTKDEINEL